MNWNRVFLLLWLFLAGGWVAMFWLATGDTILDAVRSLYWVYSDSAPTVASDPALDDLYPVPTGSLGASLPKEAASDEDYTFLGLAEVRSRFPQYKDMPEAEVSNTLYCPYLRSTQRHGHNNAGAVRHCEWAAAESWKLLGRLLAHTLGAPLISLVLGLAIARMLRRLKSKSA